jgi:competence protein ComEC
MTAWILPAVAAALWTGMLGWEVLVGGSDENVPGSALVLAALAVLAGAVWLSPRTRAASEPGLVPQEPPSSPRDRLRSLSPAGVPGMTGFLTRGGRPEEAGRIPPGAAGSSAPEPLEPARAPPLAPPLVPPLVLPLALVISVLLAFCLLGAGWWELFQERVQRSRLAGRVPAAVTLWGSLASDPVAGSSGWSARLAVVSVRPTGPTGARSIPVEPVRETVWIHGDGPLPDARRADRIVVSGDLELPWDEEFAVSLRRRGIAALLRVSVLRRVGPPTNPLVRAASATRTALSDRLRALLPAREAGLLMGLILGDTSGLDPADEEHFRATGLGHLLAVSGQNVAMVLAPVLGLAMLARAGGTARFAIGLGTVVFFVLLTGVEPSVLRAGTMAGLALVGILLGRPRSSMSLLGASVLVLLVVDPTLAWSVGFQLSVSATAGLVLMAGPFAERLRFLPRPVALALGATLAAQVGVSPLLLHHFGVVPLVTVVANLLALPAVAPALLIGLAAAGASLALPPLGAFLALVAGFFVRYLEAVADRLAAVPLPTVTSEGGPAVLVGGLAVAVGLAIWLRRGRATSRRRTVLVGCVLVPGLLGLGALRAGPPGALVVRFLDVGQGDSVLVQTPDGGVVLIDGGPDEQEVATRLAALGVKRLDVVVASHTHADHITGLSAVLARFPVGVLLEPGCHWDSSTEAAFLRAVRDEGVPVRYPRSGEVLSVGGLRLEVLGPTGCHTGTDSDPNNDSVVFRATWGDDTVLFTGDAEEPAQEFLLRSPDLLLADVLKVPHQGGGTSLLEFFDAVRPTVAVISVGENEYGHPVPEVIDRLEGLGALVLRTDLSGEVTVAFEPGGLVVRAARDQTVPLESAAA